jgi:alpha-amylase
MALEGAAAEMAGAAAALVSAERDLIAMVANGADDVALSTKQAERAEASSQLERKMAAMQAILTSRRKLMEAPKAAVPALPSFLQPPPSVKTTGPAAGNGYEIILQGFNWESCKEPWYKRLAGMAPEIAAAGFTSVWMPPMSDAVSPQGYLPRDLYDLNSKYGSEAELRDLIAVLHERGLKAIADIVINHRCAHYQGPDGKWNKFGGRLAWDSSVVCSNNAAYGGTGGRKKTEDYPAAPNLDHSQERVRKDIIEWMRWLRNSIGFDGWRFDFVKVSTGCLLSLACGVVPADVLRGSGRQLLAGARHAADSGRAPRRATAASTWASTSTPRCPSWRSASTGTPAPTPTAC